MTRVSALAREAGIDPAGLERVARLALEEDLAAGIDVAGDVTTQATVPAADETVGDVVAREPGTIAGLPVAVAVFELQLDGRGRVSLRTRDGERVGRGEPLLIVSGPTQDVLAAERCALNLLCHLSGVATLTSRWVDALAGTDAVVRDTRKTTPGLRELEKYAVRCGGGSNHRMGLNDAALIKDNHVQATGGVAAALAAVRERYPGLACEVECDTIAQVREALDAAAQLVLLDNMSLAELRESVALARGYGALTEASGGIALADAAAVAATGVDYLAVGALTHSAPALDLALDLR